MEIFRFSNDAFKPQYQDHHYKEILELMSDEWFYNYCLPNSPEHLRLGMTRTHEERKPFYEANIEYFKYGIWVFTSLNFSKQSLNHLIIMPKLYKAEIEDDAICYSVNLDSKHTITKCPCSDVFGCYTPEQELYKISNIIKLDNPYQDRTYSEFYKRE